MKQLITIITLALTGLAGLAHDSQGTTISPAVAAARPGATTLAGGMASGTWNLPSPGADGFAFGVLHLGGSFPFYLLSVALPAGNVQVVGDHLEGTFFGALQAFPLSPLGTGFPLVSGTWRSDGPAGGTFTGILHTGGGPLGMQTIQLGVIGGSFHDLVLPGGPDFLGSFEGLWMLTPPNG